MAENKLRFTDEEIHKANNIDIMDYAIRKGLELKFESPIEVLSYLTIMKLYNKNPKHHMVSLGGVTDKALERYLIDNMDIKDIVCCLNNDQAGIGATEKIKSKYKEKYNIIEKFPANKDYNEDLINIKNLIKDKDLPLKSSYKDKIQEEEFSLEC